MSWAGAPSRVSNRSTRRPRRSDRSVGTHRWSRLRCLEIQHQIAEVVALNHKTEAIHGSAPHTSVEIRLNPFRCSTWWSNSTEKQWAATSAAWSHPSHRVRGLRPDRHPAIQRRSHCRCRHRPQGGQPRQIRSVAHQRPTPRAHHPCARTEVRAVSTLRVREPRCTGRARTRCARSSSNGTKPPPDPPSRPPAPAGVAQDSALPIWAIQQGGRAQLAAAGPPQTGEQFVLMHQRHHGVAGPLHARQQTSSSFAGASNGLCQ